MPSNQAEITRDTRAKAREITEMCAKMPDKDLDFIYTAIKVLDFAKSTGLSHHESASPAVV